MFLNQKLSFAKTRCFFCQQHYIPRIFSCFVNRKLDKRYLTVLAFGSGTFFLNSFEATAVNTKKKYCKAFPGFLSVIKFLFSIVLLTQIHMNQDDIRDCHRTLGDSLDSAVTAD